MNGLNKKQQWAQVALYDLFFESAYYTAYRIVKNKMAAEDAVHEGYIKAFKKIDSLKNPEIVESWLKRIVINEALATIKAEKHFTDLSDTTCLQEASEKEPIIPLSKLLETIEELPEGYRIICQLHLIEEMKHEEIAESIGITASTSRSQLARAKSKLRQLIKEKRLLE